MRQKMEDMVKAAQDRICAAISAFDGTAFREDEWQREGGGGGRTRVISDGNHFEKAGIGVSVVHGTLPPDAAQSMRGQSGATSETPPTPFFAAGLSLVFHPRNPMAPTVHANVRYFERDDGKAPGSWWFGGGMDLTPSFLFEEDARHFHRTLKAVCDAADPSYYARFKPWCDEYFRISHRNESRGIGGIFFDDLHGPHPEPLFDFVRGVADAVVPSYLPILERRVPMPFSDEQKDWQQIRRGRYVEFNLVYDRGTVFGLKTNARIESVLMSLPLTARWEYDHTPAPGTEQARLLEVLKTPREWI